ncbi:MAG: CHAP domain-containing protein, partial [Candidatus Saccharimonadales bacterium]
NKQYLADDVKTMYEQGQMSMIEELATSQNLSTFVNKQEDDIKIQDNLNTLLTTIKTLQQQAQANADEVSALLKTEQAQQSQIASDESQQAQLLNMNQQQQSDYNSQIAANNAQIAVLKAEQAAANAAIARTVQVKPSGGGGGACDIGYGNGGYPSVLCDTAQDAILDAYGFPNRECTSFAYWYFVNIEGNSSFQVNGNAGWWWETSNYAVSTYPDVNVGAIGVEPSSALNAPVPSLHGGYYGHVMIVLALPGTTYDGHLPYTSAAAGTYVPEGYVLVMSMNEDEEGHFMYSLWPANYLMYINTQ